MITKKLRDMEDGDKLEFELKDRVAVSKAISRLHAGPGVYSSRVVEDKNTKEQKLIVMRIR